MRITREHDFIDDLIIGVDNMLLLHPDLIEEELSKLEKYCPIYIHENNGKMSNILIPNKSIESGRYTDELKYYIPTKTDVYMPIGGVDGRYYLQTYGTYIDEKTDFTRDIGYSIVDKKTNRVVYEGEKLRFLDRNLAILDKLYITKNTVFFHEDESIYFFETGYFILKIEKNEGCRRNILALYDAEGELVGTDYSKLTYDDMTKIAMNAPNLPDITLPKNINLFEQMIISSLKDKKEFKDCDANNLIDIVNYLKSKNLEIAIDLNSLTVYKVNYQRYFDHLAPQKRNATGPKLELKNK